MLVLYASSDPSAVITPESSSAKDPATNFLYDLTHGHKHRNRESSRFPSTVYEPDYQNEDTCTMHTVAVYNSLLYKSFHTIRIKLADSRRTRGDEGEFK